MPIPIEKCIFIDFETRHGPDSDGLKKSGAYRYATSAKPIICSYAIGMGPARAVWNIDGLSYDHLPRELRRAVEDESMIRVAWNAPFDRAIWNYSMEGSPFAGPDSFVDAAAQAMAANLPAKLELAAERVARRKKRDSGKTLIPIFSKQNGPRPEDRPAQWREFIRYAIDDIPSMRDIWLSTLQLSDHDWRVYWANEATNERGVSIDLPFVEAAADLTDEAVAEAKQAIIRLTGGAINSLMSPYLARYVYDRLPDEVARDIMVTALPDPDEDDTGEGDDDGEDIVKLPSISIARDNVVRLLLYLRSIEYEKIDPVLIQILELREYGASASPKKFRAMLGQHVGAKLRGMLVFNGAGQTGRFSGRLAQLQNMTRETLGEGKGDDYGTYEAPTVDMIAEGCTLAQLHAAKPTDTVALRKLGLVVRPAVIAAPKRTLIKADYKQVEARVLPFLAGPEGEARLDAFRAIDSNPKAPDSYRVTAGSMFGIDPFDVTSEQRQAGKISDLACGFGGAHAALMGMGVKYRLYFSEEEARYFVKLWRSGNPWAPRFWGAHRRGESYGLFGAAMRAYNNPGVPQQAGRISYYYDRGYFGGTLFAILPSGRLITYPYCAWRPFQKRDKRTKEVIEVVDALVFRRPMGWRAIWPGLLCENVVQAAAADLLRASLVDMDDAGLDVVLHAHDELTVEADEDKVDDTIACMTGIMLNDRGWAKGLPLGVDCTTRFYYSAAKVRHAA